MRLNSAKNKKILIRLKQTLVLFFALVSITNAGILHVSAESIFNLMGVVKYTDGSSTINGDNLSPNSFARATAYRSNLNINGVVSNKPSNNQIYPAGYASAGDPAYFLFDVGSSSWTPKPTVGDNSIVILETYPGLNGWSGDAYVARVKKTITQNDLNTNGIDYAAASAVMEKIPTPEFESATFTSIDIAWNALWDNNSGLSGGTLNGAITGYSIYRNDNGAGYELVGTVNQNAGQRLTFTDSSVILGHSYKYKLKVRFEWSAHSPSYLESSGESAESIDMSPAIPNPDRIAFTTEEQTINAGTVSNLMTIQTRDDGGNDTPVQVNTTIELSSNSTSPNKTFFQVQNGSCTSNIITNVIITSGNSTAQFCYYDEVANLTGWTLTAHKTNPPEGDWIDGTQNIIVRSGVFTSLEFNLETTQNNKVPFSGINNIVAYDSFLNIKENFNAATENISITVSPNDGSITGLSGTGTQLVSADDFVNGVADLTGKLTFSGTSGYHSFTATSSSGKVAISPSVLINPAQATHLSINVPTNVTAGTQFDITSITALDEFNNVDTSFNGNKLVTYSGAANGPTGTTPVFTTGVNFTNGVSTTALNTILVKAETTSLNIEVENLTGISNEFTVNPATAEYFLIDSPTSATAGVEFNLNSITAYDHYGNIDTNYTGVKTLSYSGAANGPSSGSPTYTTEVEFDNGSSVTTLTTQLVKKESIQITITDGLITGLSEYINVAAGQVGSIEYVSGNNQTAQINSFVAEPLVVAVKDLFGNPKNNYPVLFVVTKSDGYLSIADPVTNNEGVASQTFRLGSTAGTDSDEVQAQINGAAGSPIVFTATATPNNPTNLVIDSPLSAVAGQEFNLTLSVLDEEGNLITDYSGVKIIEYSGANASANNTNPTLNTSVEFINGSATIPITLVKAESALLSLTIAEDNLSGTADPINVSAATTHSFQVVAPSTVQSGVSFNLVSVTTIDQFANISNDYTGSKTLTYSGPTADPVTGSTPIYTTTVSFSSSASTTTLSTTLFKAETVAITVKDGSIEGTSNAITVTYADYVIYYVSGNNQVGVAGQTLEEPIKVIVLDNQGQPAIDKTVLFTVTTGNGSVGVPNTLNPETGETSTTWTLGTAVGNQSVVASVDGIQTTITFNATAVADSASLITIAPLSIATYVGYSTEAINVCLHDQFGNQVVTNLPRSINLNSTSNTGEFATEVAGQWGIGSADIQTGQSCVNIYYKDTRSGNFTFSASGNGLTTATSSVVVAALTPTTIVVNPSSFTINENNSQQLSAIVYDQFSKSMTNVTVVWEMENTNAGTITQNGLYTPVKVAGTYENAIKVSFGGIIAHSTPTVTVTPAPVIPTPPQQPVVTPQQPQITPSVPVVVPNIPTTPVVINVDEDYFSDDEGTVEVTIEVPVVSILSPRQGSLILSNGHVNISGTSIPNQIVVVKDEQNNILGSVTSDNNGYWKLFVSRNKFFTDQGTITATVYNTNVSTAPLTFDFKPRSFGEYLYDLIFNN